MIPEIEKRILFKISFAEKYLSIRKEFRNDGINTPIFKKNEIITIFKELGYPCNYIVGGAYVIERQYKDYKFEYSFIISKNSVNIYLHIYKKNSYIENRVTNIGAFLRYVPYNQELAEKINASYGLNSLRDLKIFLYKNIALCDEFVNEYIKEINAGNAPE
ncbi:MAG TPA: hypothetical protein VF677_14045 [Flavobacterium sp.]|jgi:hypothetical protein